MKKEKTEFLIKKINAHIPEENCGMVEQLIRELIERAENEGFMEGYEYAIKLLQESMIKKNS